MNYRRFLHGAKFWFWVALFVAYSAGAVGLLMIDTYEDRYRHLSKVELTTVKAQEDVRRVGASQVAAVYRAQSGMPLLRCRQAVPSRWCGPMGPPRRW